MTSGTKSFHRWKKVVQEELHLFKFNKQVNTFENQLKVNYEFILSHAMHTFVETAFICVFIHTQENEKVNVKND